MLSKYAALTSFLLLSSQVRACEIWKSPVRVGVLPSSSIPEASGLAMSFAHPKRLYHIDDGRFNNHLFWTQEADSNIYSAMVLGFEPRNLEAITVGKCGQEICVFLGDIGDNKSKRPNLQIALFAEKVDWEEKIQPMNIAEIFYPDGSHNAEAMLIWQDRMYIFTKESKPISRVYSVEVSKLMAAKSEVELRLDGEVGLAAWPSSASKAGKFNITDAAINTKTDDIHFLTQSDLYIMPAAELLNLKRENSQIVKRIPLKALKKQEGISVNSADGSFYVSSETDGYPTSDILKYDCSL